jgi:hypothetical protein
MKPEKVKSLGDFTTRVCDIRTDWSIAEDNELWFRGEKRDYETTRLRPVLYRPPVNRSLKPIPDLLKIEDDLFDAFQRSNSPLYDGPIEGDFDGYLLMQHHGGPTRLLDWSDGSLMALHFALRNKQGDDSDSVVYVLDPNRLIDRLNGLAETIQLQQRWAEHVKANPTNDEDDESSIYLPASPGDERALELPPVPLVLQFPFISRRVAAQRSQFIVFGSDPSWLSNEVTKVDSPIRCITIDGTRTRAIRAELRECGVTESVIFPDLDGLGRELNQLWQDRQ